MMKQTTVLSQSQQLAHPSKMSEVYYDELLKVTPSYVKKRYLTKALGDDNPPQNITRHIAIKSDEVSPQVEPHIMASLKFLVENEKHVNDLRRKNKVDTVSESKDHTFRLTFNTSTEGGCSHVYYGSFCEQNPPKDPNPNDFVIKIARDNTDEDEWVPDRLGVAQFNEEYPLYNNVAMLIQEIKMLSSLSVHANIIPLLGFSYLGYRPKKQRSIIDTFAIFPKYDSNARYFFARFQSINDMIHFLCQIMQGLIFLQNNEIVHHDVKLENCFIQSNDFHCVIADFGTAIHLKQHQTMEVSDVSGTADFLPPERLRRPRQINHTLDTVGWAFMILELFCLLGKHLYPEGIWRTMLKLAFDNPYFATVPQLILFMQSTQNPTLQNKEFDQELATLRIQFNDKEYSQEIYQYYQNSIDENSTHRLAFTLASCFVSVIQTNVDQRPSKEALLEFLKPMTNQSLAPIP